MKLQKYRVIHEIMRSRKGRSCYDKMNNTYSLGALSLVRLVLIPQLDNVRGLVKI